MFERLIPEKNTAGSIPATIPTAVPRMMKYRINVPESSSETVRSTIVCRERK
jgi:hypothetical protein